MANINSTVTMNDGTKIVVSHDESATDEQISSLAIKKYSQTQSEPQAPAESQLGRTFAQGLTFGFADEIEAGVRAVVPESLGGRKYKEIRDELRKKLNQYKEENPTAALTAEVAGAFLPTVVALVSSGGTAAPALAPTLLRMGKIGAVEGGVYGLGASEEKDITGMAIDTGMGAATGAVAAPLLGGAVTGALKAYGGIIDFAKNIYGDRVGKVVRNEINRMKQQTGKTDVELMDDMANGRLVPENETLTLVLKDYILKGGKAGKYVLDKFTDRASYLTKTSLSDLKENLAPNVDDNAFRAFQQSQDAIKKSASKEYNQIFEAFPDLTVTENVTSPMKRAVQADAEIFNTLNAKYTLAPKADEEKLVPLFKRNKDSSIEFARQPSLKDAEEIRRLVFEKKEQLFKAGQGSLATDFADIETSLRSGIDEISNPLKKTRAKWASVAGAAEKFDMGRKSLNKPVDELQVMVDEFRKKPDLFTAFKAGVMDGIRNKFRINKSSFARLSQEDAQLGGVLRVALDGEDIASLERQLSHTGEVIAMKGGLPTSSGSPTEGLRRQGALTVSDVASAAGGDTVGILNVVNKIASKLRQQAPQLSDDQRLQVAKIMFNEAPEITKRAVGNQGAYNTLMANFGQKINTFTVGGRTEAIQQSGQYTGGLLQPQ